TRSARDCSSDVCSSDLPAGAPPAEGVDRVRAPPDPSRAARVRGAEAALQRVPGAALVPADWGEGVGVAWPTPPPQPPTPARARSRMRGYPGPPARARHARAAPW